MFVLECVCVIFSKPSAATCWQFYLIGNRCVSISFKSKWSPTQAISLIKVLSDVCTLLCYVDVKMKKKRVGRWRFVCFLLTLPREKKLSHAMKEWRWIRRKKKEEEEDDQRVDRECTPWQFDQRCSASKQSSASVNDLLQLSGQLELIHKCWVS